LFCGWITDALEGSESPGRRPRFSCRFPVDHDFATSLPLGGKIDTTSAILIQATICEGNTIARHGGQGHPRVADSEFAVPAINAPPLSLRGGLVPAEVVAPDHPINVVTASECAAPF
jgi:hypothetical protein